MPTVTRLGPALAAAGAWAAGAAWLLGPVGCWGPQAARASTRRIRPTGPYLQLRILASPGSILEPCVAILHRRGGPRPLVDHAPAGDRSVHLDAAEPLGRYGEGILGHDD